MCVRYQHGESRALEGDTIAPLFVMETSLEISVNREQRDEGGGTKEGRNRHSLLLTVLVAEIDYLSIQQLGQS